MEHFRTMYKKNNFKELLHEIIEKSLSSIIHDKDIYAYSLWFYFEDDDYFKPSFELSYNKKSTINLKEKKSFLSLETKWNFALWDQKNILLQYDKNIFKKLWTDYLYKNNIIEKGKEYSKDRVFDIFDNSMDLYVKTIISVIKKINVDLKNNNPIIIHNLEYNYDVLSWNIEANKNIDDFDKFIESLYDI